MNENHFACSALSISRQHTCAKVFVTVNKAKGYFCHFSYQLSTARPRR